VPSPRTINPRLPASVESIILRALAKPREDRFQTMDEFAAALLDPAGYAASAPAHTAHTSNIVSAAIMDSPGIVPNGRADSVASGQVVFGNSNTEMGARSVPLPSTFRHAVGELTQEEEEEKADLEPAPKPRKAALIIAAVTAAAVAGLTIFFFSQGSTNPASSDQTATVAKPTTPKMVRLSFKSDPAGAAVLRKDTNEQIGVTPFTVELPASQTSVDFLFKKDSFGDKIETFVPAESGQLAVAMIATPAQVPSQPSAEAKPENKQTGRTPAVGHRKPSSSAGRKHGGHAMDEDGVLAPSF
jgi:hypothetical protein